jgi:3-methyladenine DNA glycosylase AlkD
MAGITAARMRAELRALGNEDIAVHSAGFFKAGMGEYGEGDQFLGIRVPILRQQVRRFREAPERSVLAMLKSKYHEERLLAVLLLVEQYKRGDAAARARIYYLYLANRRYVNNWDIVDSSAHLIVGPQLQDGDRRVLFELAASDVLWDRRIAMMATLHYIRQRDFVDALALAELLLEDDEDLIHKAVGWMLREIGNRDRAAEEAFLGAHYTRMPRTMLRYAIEKFPERRRRAYLNGTV